MALTPTESLDVRGKTCPYPILETGAALRNIDAGEVLEVLVDYMPSVRDGLPNFCKKYDCEFESSEQNSGENAYWKFLIEKSEKL
jgi:tRNA 2-thiouridine synthesizing protein A